MEKAGRAVGARVRALACVFPHVDLQLIIPEVGAEGKMKDGEAEANRNKT